MNVQMLTLKYPSIKFALLSKGSITLIILLVLPIVISAQNLVPNPSFECYEEDPCEFTNDSQLAVFPKRACSWSLPNEGTSDIFSSIVSPSCWTSMPNSSYSNAPYLVPFGSQNPRTGKRFAGLFTYFGNQFPSYEPSYREYIQVGLLEPLLPGKSYCAEMFVSVSERPRYATNKLAMCFTNRAYSYDEWEDPFSYRGFTLPFEPQIVEESIIVDTLNWVRVSGIYKAVEASSHLIIGNFSNDNETNVVDKGGHYMPYNYETSYYYIDDISVEEIQPRYFEFAGTTEICRGGESNIVTSGGLVDIEWSTLADTTTIIATGSLLRVNPQTTTAYRVKGRNCDEIIKDTLEIIVHPLPELHLEEVRILCRGSSLVLDAGEGTFEYDWSDGSQERTLLVDSAGQYSLTVRDEYGCTSTNDITIFSRSIPRPSLGSDTLLCNGFFTLKPKSEEVILTYQWSSGSTDSLFTPSKSGRYWVTVGNNCGFATDSINIYSLQDIFIPNVLTLNQDTNNEKFEIVGIGPDDSTAKLVIFNRWGEQVFEASHYDDSWPSESDEIPAGVYYYSLVIPGCSPSKGWIQIIK
jgi:gliding motility-associated-like protein